MAIRYTLRDVRRTLRARGAELRRFPNVLRVGIGREVQHGHRQERLAIRVFVARKPSSLPRDGRLPTRLRGVAAGQRSASFWIPVDVEVAPRRLKALGIAAGTDVQQAGAGTVGLTYTSRSGKTLLLSNAHVLAGVGRRAINRVVRSGGRRVAEVHRTIPLWQDRDNTMDASVAWVYQNIATDELRIRGVEGVVGRLSRLGAHDAYDFFYVNRFGVRKAVRDPQELGHPIDVDVGNVTVAFSGCLTLTVDGTVAEQGDSGSVVVRRSGAGLVACGLLFAGAGSTIAVFQLDDALRALSRAAASDGGDQEDVGVAFG